MSTTRPTDLPTWASAPVNPADDVKEPPASKQAGGWLFEEPPPYNFVNWFWNRVASWAQHFSATASRFEQPEDAVENAGPVLAGAVFPVGGTCLVKGDEDNIPGATHTADAAALGASGGTVAASGRSFAVQFGDPDAGGAGDIEVFRRDGTGTKISTILAAATRTPRLLNDGVHVAWADGNSIRLNNHDNGTSVYSVALAPGAINDIAWTHDRIYVVGTFASGQLKAINRLTGATIWSYDHNADLHSVAVYGNQVFVAGDASGHGSGATIRSVRASDGFDNAGEGGLGTDALQWDAVQGTPSTLQHMLAADGRGLYVGQGQEVDVRGLADGLVVDSITTPFTDDVRSVNIDHERLVVGTSNRTTGGGGSGALHVFDRDTLAQVWRYRDGAGDTRIHDTATDGHALFVAQEIGLANTLPRLYRGTRTGWWQRVDPSTSAALAIGALRQLLIPITRA